MRITRSLTIYILQVFGFQVDTITKAAEQSDSENIKSRGDKLSDRYVKIKRLADETAARLDENAQGKSLFQ